MIYTYKNVKMQHTRSCINIYIYKLKEMIVFLYKILLPNSKILIYKINSIGPKILILIRTLTFLCKHLAHLKGSIYLNEGKI